MSSPALLCHEDREGADGNRLGGKRKVHFNTCRIEVTHDAASAPVEALIAAVKSGSYAPRPPLSQSCACHPPPGSGGPTTFKIEAGLLNGLKIVAMAVIAIHSREFISNCQK